MRNPLALALLLVVVLAGCGGSGRPQAEQVVRAWSTALEAGDNEAAADLFARGATVVQGSFVVLSTYDEAVRWNAALPCTGTVVELENVSAEVVSATFALGDRTPGSCSGAGARVTVVFTVRHGQIEVFHQLLSPPAYTALYGERA